MISDRDLVLRSGSGVGCEPLRALWAEVMPSEPLGTARFADLLSRPTSGDAWLLRRDGEPIGFAQTAVHRSSAETRGWLVGFGVRSQERGHGYGQQLVASAVESLRQKGATRIDVGGPGEAYVIPGVDPDAYPGAGSVLCRCGFRRCGATEGMRVTLPAPPPVAPPSGVALDTLDSPGKRAAAVSEISASFSESWADQIARSPVDGRVRVAMADGQVVGFAGHDLFPGCPGRFGPTGVVPAMRGRGIGGVLLRDALARMAALGHRSAWFLWGPEGASGKAMYRSAGFVADRRFDFYTRAFDVAGETEGGQG